MQTDGEGPVLQEGYFLKDFNDPKGGTLYETRLEEGFKG
jgi:hypothetical protein